MRTGRNIRHGWDEAANERIGHNCGLHRLAVTERRYSGGRAGPEVKDAEEDGRIWTGAREITTHL